MLNLGTFQYERSEQVKHEIVLRSELFVLAFTTVIFSECSYILFLVKSNKEKNAFAILST